MRIRSGKLLALTAAILTLAVSASVSGAMAATVSDSGSTGVEGLVNAAPPSTAPTISTPTNGQTFSSLPVTVSGLCQKDLLVEIFKNGVFSGSTQCSGGSYSLQIDLFIGRNDLIARQYDNLNQASPDSSIVTVNFNNALPVSGPRITLTTAYAKRGADPGTPLSWPITISGGVGPYAISADWGDGSAADLISKEFPGDTTVQHTYDQSGVYNVIIKATDKLGSAAYLQVVGIGNGPILQATKATGTGATAPQVQKQVIWWPMAILAVLVMIAFWLGSRHQLEVIRNRLRHGERPFK